MENDRQLEGFLEHKQPMVLLARWGWAVITCDDA